MLVQNYENTYILDQFQTIELKIIQKSNKRYLINQKSRKKIMKLLIFLITLLSNIVLITSEYLIIVQMDLFQELSLYSSYFTVAFTIVLYLQILRFTNTKSLKMYAFLDFLNISFLYSCFLDLNDSIKQLFRYKIYIYMYHMCYQLIFFFWFGELLYNPNQIVSLRQVFTINFMLLTVLVCSLLFITNYNSPQDQNLYIFFQISLTFLPYYLSLVTFTQYEDFFGVNLTFYNLIIGIFISFKVIAGHKQLKKKLIMFFSDYQLSQYIAVKICLHFQKVKLINNYYYI
ncbi:transmembrane protein, putative (macronuclear) [Tetrahymena thermophila SB210]|uniref:Transmembrane protein, putative n=1 Tax=Tetrahymena thermophila (strain SB210) TaxID=312017 RepID=W7XB52_TETTS|nr:transmembrane protein, putative [Tetrahymena thermophila SB210]EWS73648.1 transmembrane protein, putative [Tetrahymena thermophila SB210]|eukprot:XP_012653778.1 transmembrane protein, putative [Tetrahymena thermophila SB210]